VTAAERIAGLPGCIPDFSAPRVMGVLNVTPDSFSDGGRFIAPAKALDHARGMIEAGADIIDVGGESTRPGAREVSEQEELDRVVPVVEALASVLGVPVSVDTSKPAVMRAAIGAGAFMINDVMALRVPGALEAAADLKAWVCLMHMQGTPRTMQISPRYGDVVTEVRDFLAERIGAARAAGVPPERLLADPGFCFGKTIEQNYQLLKGLPALKQLGVPLLVGMSRKSMLGSVTGRPVEERVFASVAAASLAIWQGATVIRVHDVAATVDALAVVRAALHG